LRCVGHPSARRFISFAKRYCDAYRNDYGWVTDGASNLDELNLLMKELSLRRLKEEVQDLPPKIRSWVPVAVDRKNTSVVCSDATAGNEIEAVSAL
jgi:SWI/SNF-related matrix-associated actin-dependent regulator 1 of chromatin subfamily A